MGSAHAGVVVGIGIGHLVGGGGKRCGIKNTGADQVAVDVIGPAGGTPPFRLNALEEEVVLLSLQSVRAT